MQGGTGPLPPSPWSRDGAPGCRWGEGVARAAQSSVPQERFSRPTVQRWGPAASSCPGRTCLSAGTCYFFPPRFSPGWPMLLRSALFPFFFLSLQLARCSLEHLPLATPDLGRGPRWGGSYREDTELATNIPTQQGGTDSVSLDRLLSDLACRLTPALLVFFLLASPVVFPRRCIPGPAAKRWGNASRCPWRTCPSAGHFSVFNAAKLSCALVLTGMLRFAGCFSPR